MRPFHLSCPYTSLPICHCHLHAAKALNRFPKPPRKENPLRRALLLDLYRSLSPPPGVSASPSPTLLHSLYTKSTYPPRNPHLPLSTPVSCHFERLDSLVADTAKQARRLRETSDTLEKEVLKLREAKDGVDGGGERDGEGDDTAFQRVGDESDSLGERDSADESFERRRAIAKRRSTARQRSRR